MRTVFIVAFRSAKARVQFSHLSLIGCDLVTRRVSEGLQSAPRLSVGLPNCRQKMNHPKIHKLSAKATPLAGRVQTVLTAGCMILAMLQLGCTSKNVASKPVAAGSAIEKVAEKGPVKMTIRISPSEPRLSDIVDMEILVSAQDKILFEPPAFGQAVGDFLVRDYSERNTDMFGRSLEPNSRLFRYRLEPVHTGTHLIRSLAIEFTDNRPDSEATGTKSRIESEPIEVNITSEFGDAVPDLANLEPMVAPQTIESTISWIWIVPAFFLIAIFAALLWATRGKKGDAAQPPKLSPEEIASMQLQQLLSEDLPAKGLVKDFYLRLTGIVREYIEGSTGSHAPEQTTEEFLRDTRTTEVFAVDQSLRLKEFLEAADMVKYAGKQPDGDQVELSIVRAREFIATKPPAPVLSVGDNR